MKYWSGVSCCFHSASVFVIFSIGCVEGEVLGGGEPLGLFAPSLGGPPSQPAKANSPTIINAQVREVECFMASQQSCCPKKYSTVFLTDPVCNGTRRSESIGFR